MFSRQQEVLSLSLWNQPRAHFRSCPRRPHTSEKKPADDAQKRPDHCEVKAVDVAVRRLYHGECEGTHDSCDSYNKRSCSLVHCERKDGTLTLHIVREKISVVGREKRVHWPYIGLISS